MDAFSKLNPKVAVLFFVCIIVLTFLFFNPVFLAAGLPGAFFYNIKLKGSRAVRSFFIFVLPLTVFISVFNMFFSHYGTTVIFSLFNSDFTLESLLYGLCQGMIFSNVIMWFGAYSQVVTTDKFLCVFGKIAPNCSLIFSIALSFIPRVVKNAEEIADARKLIQNSGGTIRKSISSFSSLITMTLEESIEISDSMKARNFSSKRSAYSKYTFNRFDALSIILVTVFTAFLIYIKVSGKADFDFEPALKMSRFSPAGLAAYLFLSLLPLIIDVSEDVKWYFLKQKT